MLDLYVCSVLFSWFVNRYVAYRTSKRITNEGYVYNKDPRDIVTKSKNNGELAFKMLMPVYNVYNALKSIFNFNASMDERKNYLLRTNRITKTQPVLVATSDGTVKTKQQILSEERRAKTEARMAELARQKRIQLNNLKENTKDSIKALRR